MQNRQQAKKLSKSFCHNLHSSNDIPVTQSSQRYHKPSGNASGLIWLKIELLDCLRFQMQERTLTADECDELAEALRQDAADLPSCSRKEDLLQLAERYRDLANMKRIVLRNVN